MTDSTIISFFAGDWDTKSPTKQPTPQPTDPPVVTKAPTSAAPTESPTFSPTEATNAPTRGYGEYTKWDQIPGGVQCQFKSKVEDQFDGMTLDECKIACDDNLFCQKIMFKSGACLLYAGGCKQYKSGIYELYIRGGSVPRSASPTKSPTESGPTLAPTKSPTTQAPTTKSPTNAPTTSNPTESPTTGVPTNTPTRSALPGEYNQIGLNKKCANKAPPPLNTSSTAGLEECKALCDDLPQCGLILHKDGKVPPCSLYEYNVCGPIQPGSYSVYKRTGHDPEKTPAPTTGSPTSDPTTNSPTKSPTKASGSADKALRSFKIASGTIQLELEASADVLTVLAQMKANMEASVAAAKSALNLAAIQSISVALTIESAGGRALQATKTASVEYNVYADAESASSSPPKDVLSLKEYFDKDESKNMKTAITNAASSAETATTLSVSVADVQIDDVELDGGDGSSGGSGGLIGGIAGGVAVCAICFAVYKFKFASSAESKDLVSAASPMPSGWTEHLDVASGRTYYFNKTTKETTWTRPKSVKEVNGVTPDIKGVVSVQMSNMKSLETQLSNVEV